MTNVLSKEELLLYLSTLKEMIQDFDYAHIQNVIFINLESFYQFINRISARGSKERVEDVLEKIEPYIPITLSDAQAEILTQLYEAPEDDVAEFSDFLMKQAKVELINLIRDAANPEDWRDLVDSFLKIRNIREKEARA